MPVETHTCTFDEKIGNSFGEAPVTISHLLNRKHIILHICIPLSHHYRRVVNLAVATLGNADNATSQPQCGHVRDRSNANPPTPPSELQSKMRIVARQCSRVCAVGEIGDV